MSHYIIFISLRKYYQHTPHSSHIKMSLGCIYECKIYFCAISVTDMLGTISARLQYTQCISTGDSLVLWSMFYWVLLSWGSIVSHIATQGPQRPMQYIDTLLSVQQFYLISKMGIPVCKASPCIDSGPQNVSFNLQTVLCNSQNFIGAKYFHILANS